MTYTQTKSLSIVTSITIREKRRTREQLRGCGPGHDGPVGGVVCNIAVSMVMCAVNAVVLGGLVGWSLGGVSGAVPVRDVLSVRVHGGLVISGAC